MAHLSQHGLMSRFQSAFRCSHSTETAILKIDNSVRSSNDNVKVSAHVLLALSAAGDIVLTMKSRLLALRLTYASEALLRFRCYHSDRDQVCYVPVSYPPRAVAYGLAQGSAQGQGKALAALRSRNLYSTTTAGMAFRAL